MLKEGHTANGFQSQELHTVGGAGRPGGPKAMDLS